MTVKQLKLIVAEIDDAFDDWIIVAKFRNNPISGFLFYVQSIEAMRLIEEFSNDKSMPAVAVSHMGCPVGVRISK